MAFNIPKGPEAYLKSTRVWIDSRTNKEFPTQSDFNYRAILPQEIQDVVSISLDSYQLPRDTVPSFYPTTSKVLGNHSLDFSLENTDIAATAQAFSVTWPTKYYQYNLLESPDYDYNTQLKKLMNDAIQANPTWKDKVRMETYAHPLQNTIIITDIVDCSLPSTTTTKVRLLFATGPNCDTSCHHAMGFAKTDIESNETTFYLNNGSQAIESPFATFLRPFPYVDVFVQESDRKPFARIYVEDTSYAGAELVDIVQNRVDTRSPPRTLKSLTIQLRYPSGRDPGQYVSRITHSFGFQITSLANEASTKPWYAEKIALLL